MTSLEVELLRLQTETETAMQNIIEKYADGKHQYRPVVSIDCRLEAYRGIPIRRMTSIAWTMRCPYGVSKDIYDWLEPLVRVDPTLEHWDVLNLRPSKPGNYTIAYTYKRKVMLAEATYNGKKWVGCPKHTPQYRILWHDGVINL